MKRDGGGGGGGNLKILVLPSATKGLKLPQKFF